MIPRIEAILSHTEKEAGKGQLLELWLEIWPYCHLCCSYCFNAAGKGQEFEGLLPVVDYLSLLESFKALGGRVIGIPGFGEPFHPRNLDLTLAIIKQARELDIRSYVFTTGDLINEHLAKELYDLDVSLMIKFNSSLENIQDKLVCTSGYTKKRERALEILKGLGFNDLKEDVNGHPTTKLGYVTSILPENYDELPELFRYCRQNNIYPDIDTLLHFGRSQDSKDEEQSVRKMMTLLQEIDKEEFGNSWEMSPAYIAGSCDRYAYHLYMDFHGNISPCLGANKKGVVLRNLSEPDALAKAWHSPLMEIVRNRAYQGKCQECKNFKLKTCNSCLGRYADIEQCQVETFGCWNFSE